MLARTDAPAVLLWSGGKDAAWALECISKQQAFTVEALLTTVVETTQTVTAHGTPLSLVKQQAAALSLPLHVMRVPPSSSNAEYETEFEQTMEPVKARGVRHVIAGDVHLEDVRDYRASLIQQIGMTPVFPLFGLDASALAEEMLSSGLQAVVTSVDTRQLAPSFVGRTYGVDFLNDLPESVDPCGENGEFHTFVTHHPAFQDPVPVQVDGIRGSGRMRYARLQASAEP